MSEHYYLIGLVPFVFAGISYLIGKFYYFLWPEKISKEEMYITGAILGLFFVAIPFVFGSLVLKINISGNLPFQILAFSLSLILIYKISKFTNEKMEYIQKPSNIWNRKGFEYDEISMKQNIYRWGAVFLLSFLSVIVGNSLLFQEYTSLIFSILLLSPLLILVPVLSGLKDIVYPEIVVYMKTGEKLVGRLIDEDDPLHILGIAYLKENEKKKRSILTHYFINKSEIKYFMIGEKPSDIAFREYLRIIEQEAQQ